MNTVSVRSVVVHGKTEASVNGRVMTLGSSKMGDIFVVKFLELDHYFQVIESKCVICETRQKTSHIIVVCRTLGIPVIEVESVNNLECGGVYLHIDFNSNTISYSNDEFQLPEVPVSKVDRHTYPRMGHNLSIVNSVVLVNEVIENCKGDVEQLFLRSEFLWLSLKNNPYMFLKEKGIDITVQTMYEELRTLYTAMKGNYILHFRGLDLRSDQRIYNDTKGTEPNPHLGLHGIRQLLCNPLYLVAELKAMDMLFETGCTNIVYSIPFVISSEEVAKVIALRNEHCKSKFKIGVFIETPASVFEIDDIVNNDISYVYLGTGDLTQLILAADRDNSAVSHLLDLHSPPVTKAIKSVVASCEKKNIPLYVFSYPTDVERLSLAVPDIKRISIPASDYFKHANR